MHSNTNIDSAQLKNVVKEHLEKNNFLDKFKLALQKDPRLASLDKQQIIDKIKKEGIFNDILSQLNINKSTLS